MMDEHEKPYTTLFNAVTDALDALDRLNFGQAKEILEAGQQRAEEIYIGEDK